MSEKLVNTIIGLFGGLTAIKFGKEILVFIISLMPILELRGGLIAAALLNLSPLKSYIICIIGNILPVPLILLLINKILSWMRNSKHFNKIANWLDKKVEKHKGQIEKYGYLGIVLEQEHGQDHLLHRHWKWIEKKHLLQYAQVLLWQV